MSPQTTAESTAVSIASPMVKRNATTVPRMAGGIAKDEHRRSVIRLDGMLYGPDPKILTLESNTGAAAGIKVTSGLIEGSGGDKAPPAEDPAHSRQGSAGPASASASKVSRQLTCRFDLIRRRPDLWGKVVRRVQWRQSVRPLGAHVFLLFVPRFMYRPTS
jgi:hypothetical protein